MARCYLTLVLVMVIANAQEISCQYEFFRLVTIWGPSHCRVYQCFRQPPAPKFTLHGLWPDNYTFDLYNCGGSRYIPLKVQRSIDARDDYWFDYFLQNPPSATRNWRHEQRFWASEWRNHGTCSKNVFSQQNYFNRAKILMFKHDLTFILFTKNPIPLPWPKVSEVMSAISKTTGFRPELRCHNYDNHKILVEVALCYDVGGERVINCPQPGFVFCGRRSTRIYVPNDFE